MTREVLFEKLQEIFRDIFDDETIIIQDSTNSTDIDHWDSLNHINLIMTIENEFKVKFNFEELAQFKNVGVLADVLLNKI
jgi:acyl carrier protein